MSIIDLIGQSLRQKADLQRELQRNQLNSPGVMSEIALNAARTKALPLESAASIAKMGAETGLIGQQAKFFGPRTIADIALTNAQVGLTSANTADVRKGLTSYTTDPASLEQVRRRTLGTTYQGFQLGDSDSYGSYSLPGMRSLPRY